MKNDPRWDDTPARLRDFAQRIRDGEEPVQGFLDAIAWQLSRAAQQLDLARDIADLPPLSHDFERVVMPSQLVKNVAKSGGDVNKEDVRWLYRYCYSHRYGYPPGDE